MKKFNTKKLISVTFLIAWLALLISITYDETLATSIIALVGFLVGVGYETTNGVDHTEEWEALITGQRDTAKK